MSYSSRVYRQRNPKVQEDSKEKPFFPKQKSAQKNKGGSFFQAKPLESPIRRQSDEKKEEKPVQSKMADQEKEKEVSVPKQGDPMKEKEITVQKKAEDDKKEIKKKAGPAEDMEKDKPKEVKA